MRYGGFNLKVLAGVALMGCICHCSNFKSLSQSFAGVCHVAISVRYKLHIF
jgi:hypothetical protein